MCGIAARPVRGSTALSVRVYGAKEKVSAPHEAADGYKDKDFLFVDIWL